MRTIGIIAALKQEAAPVIRGMAAPCYAKIGSLTICRGAVGGRPVAVAVSGAGRKAAGNAVKALIELSRPNLIISIGFAGALTENLTAGAVVIANELVDEEGVREVFRTPEGFIPPDGGLGGILLTSRRFISSVDHKRRLSRQFGAVAVDMESIHIGRIAREAGIPFFVVRIISDDLSGELPVMESFTTGEGRVVIKHAIPYFLRHPATLIPFIVFTARLASHADTLGGYLGRLIGSLPPA